MWLKLYCPIVSSDSGNVNELKFVHMKNAFFSMAFSCDPSAKVTDRSFLQPEKTSSSMFSRLAGMSILQSPEPWKQDFPIL